MNDKWDKVKKELAFTLYARGVFFASGLICCYFGVENFGMAGGCLGAAVGMIAGFMILMLQDERRAAREEANADGQAPGKRGRAQDDDLLAYKNLYRASSNDGPKPRR